MPHPPPPSAPGNHHSIFWPEEIDYSKYLIKVESYNICSSMFGYFFFFFA